MSKEYELISVIMSIYKEPIQWVVKALNSIMNQTYPNVELIVIIDNPDNVEAINYIKKLGANNLKWLVNDRNVGLVRSLNKALKMCSGKYIARMDADDYSYPNRLEREYFFIKKNGFDIVGTAYEIFEKDKIIDTRYNPRHSIISKRVLRYKNCIVHPSWLIKTEVYDDLDGYRQIDACEDYDFLVRAVLKGYKIGNINEVLFQYRNNENSISHIKYTKQVLTMQYISNAYRCKNIIDLGTYNTYIGGSEYDIDARRLQQRYKFENKIDKEKNIIRKILTIIEGMLFCREYRVEKIRNQYVKLLFVFDKLM